MHQLARVGACFLPNFRTFYTRFCPLFRTKNKKTHFFEKYFRFSLRMCKIYFTFVSSKITKH